MTRGSLKNAEFTENYRLIYHPSHRGLFSKKINKIDFGSLPVKFHFKRINHCICFLHNLPSYSSQEMKWRLLLRTMYM